MSINNPNIGHDSSFSKKWHNIEQKWGAEFDYSKLDELFDVAEGEQLRDIIEEYMPLLMQAYFMRRHTVCNHDKDGKVNPEPVIAAMEQSADDAVNLSIQQCRVAIAEKLIELGEPDVKHIAVNIDGIASHIPEYEEGYSDPAAKDKSYEAMKAVVMVSLQVFNRAFQGQRTYIPYSAVRDPVEVRTEAAPNPDAQKYDNYDWVLDIMNKEGRQVTTRVEDDINI